MNKYHYLTFLLLILTLSNLTAQTEENSIGINHWIDSQILEERRKIQIYLPDGYESSQVDFPVLYILDGQRFFLHAVGIQQSFRQYELTPGFIVVGITTGYPDRFTQFGQGKEKFMDFFKEEVIPYIEENYRIDDHERILFGWEYGAAFTFHSLLTQPDFFEAYLMASPYPILEHIHRLDQFERLNKVLIYAVSPDEYEINHAIDQLDSLLSSKNLDGLDYLGLRLENEEHRSTGYVTLYHGLRHIFRFYPEFQEDNLDRLLKKGGLGFAQFYIEERARRYGFTPKLSLWSKYTLIRSAIRADDFSHFQEFIQKLDLESMIVELIENQRTYGVFEILSFYKKNDQCEKVNHLVKFLNDHYPLLNIPSSVYENTESN